MKRRTAIWSALGAALVLAGNASARAESALLLPPPEITGGIAASTYDERGERVGDAEIAFEKLENGNFLLRGLSGIEGSARAEVRAELAPVEGGRRLQLVRQQSEAHDEQGVSLGVMRIDHEKGFAICGVPEGSTDEPQRVPLPDRDRVVNVPLNLLFQPLVRGEVDQIRFQILLCRAGARLVDAKAEVEQDSKSEAGRLVEVRYDLDFGPLLSRLAAPFMPRLSFWFDKAEAGGWVGHRMPLFSKGPTVLVIRSGVAPSALGAGQ